MYCLKCGTENPDGAQLCQSCSAVLSSTATQAPAADAKTSGLAIASLVLAILSPFTCMIAAIPAIILGIVALVKISKSSGQLKGSGLAIAGIAVPSISAIFVLPLMLGIMMPALARVRQIAFRTVCATNLRQVGIVMTMYAEENNQYPTADRWCDLLLEQAEITKNSFKCPSAPEGPCNYAINKNIEELGADAPPDMVLLFETHPGWNQAGGHEILTTENHNGQGCNVVFVDSHVAFIKTKNLKGLKW